MPVGILLKAQSLPSSLYNTSEIRTVLAGDGDKNIIAGLQVTPIKKGPRFDKLVDEPAKGKPMEQILR